MLLFLNLFCLVFGSYCCYCWSYCQHAPCIYLYHLKTLPPSSNTMLMYFNKSLLLSQGSKGGTCPPLDGVVISVLSGCSSSRFSKEPLVAKFYFVHSPILFEKLCRTRKRLRKKLCDDMFCFSLMHMQCSLL